MKRGIMARMLDVLRGSRFVSFPPTPPVIVERGRVTSTEEYEKEVQRMIEREARLRRMGFELDTTARRKGDGYG